MKKTAIFEHFLLRCVALRFHLNMNTDINPTLEIIPLNTNN